MATPDAPASEPTPVDAVGFINVFRRAGARSTTRIINDEAEARAHAKNATGNGSAYAYSIRFNDIEATIVRLDKPAAA